MIALAVTCLMAGAAAGVILMGMVSAGRREDDCRACRRDKAFRVADDCDKVEGQIAGARSVNCRPHGLHRMDGERNE